MFLKKTFANYGLVDKITTLKLLFQSEFAFKIKGLVLIISYKLILKSYPNNYYLTLLCDFVIVNLDKV